MLGEPVGIEWRMAFKEPPTVFHRVTHLPVNFIQR